MTVILSSRDIRALILDIEGTTTPVAFVNEVMFPFARRHVADYLARKDQSEPCREALALLAADYESDLEQDAGPAGVVQALSPAGADRALRQAEIVAYVHWLMDRDRKTRGLKALQGLIWQEGYRRGELRGQIFPDVPPALERWRARGLGVFIYSSGSVLAQQLLFESTQYGDLTAILSGYFDTVVGPKTSRDSYRTIASLIGVPPARALFVSDVIGELDAARAAGLETVLCVRGETPAGSDRYPAVRSFDEIVL